MLLTLNALICYGVHYDVKIEYIVVISSAL